jgi:tetratricopeptide (TPR) repeat protein
MIAILLAVPAPAIAKLYVPSDLKANEFWEPLQKTSEDFRRGLYGRAQKSLEELSKKDPNNADILFDLACCFYKQHSYTNALLLFLETTDECVDSEYFAGNCYQALNNTALSSKHYRNYLSRIRFSKTVICSDHACFYRPLAIKKLKQIDSTFDEMDYPLKFLDGTMKVDFSTDNYPLTVEDPIFHSFMKSEREHSKKSSVLLSSPSDK